MLTIKGQKDTRTVHACTNNLADIPGGVTVNVADLVDGSILQEGTAIGFDNSGVAHVIKCAQVTEAANNSATAYKIKKGSQFKVGDILSLGVGKVGKAITAIDTTNAGYDEVTVGATLGTSVNIGYVLVQANAAASSSVLKYKPVALVGDSYNVVAGTNIFVPAITIGQFKLAVCPPLAEDVKTALKTIVFI